MLESEQRNHKSNHSARILPVVPEEGLYASMLINASPEVVFTLCQEKMSLEKVLEDLPYKASRLVALNLKEASETDDGHYKLRFKNYEDSKLSGTLDLFIAASYNGRGTLLTAEASLDIWKSGSDSPSTLLNGFLKRLKSLLETGEIATTKGQPSGRDELKTLH
jgi:hypothetical protein